MTRHVLPLLMLTAALAGCSSSGGGVSTASILGTAPTPPPVAGQAAPGQAQPGQPGVTPVVAPAAPTSDPTSRAFNVGTVSARAVKCGYNFDAARVKASYLAHEAGLGATNEQVATLQKIYDVSFNGVTKAAAEQPDYCSEQKTQKIKTDLNRILAGDFEPPLRQIVQKKDDGGGFFGGFFDGGSSGDEGPKYGSDDWWAKQNEKMGN